MSQVDPLGSCGRVIDESKELVCGTVAVAEILVRTKFGLMVVRLCQKDLDEHRAFYRARNQQRNHPRNGRNQRQTYQPPRQ